MLRIPVSLLFILSICCFGDGKGKRNHNGHIPTDFASVRFNEYGEKELRIVHRRILLLETAASLDGQLDLVIRQVTDGRRFVQGVFQQGILKDCDYDQDSKRISEFVITLASLEAPIRQMEFGNILDEYRQNTKLHNTTVAFRYLRRSDDAHKLSEFLDVKALTKRCHKLAKRLKHIAKEKARHLNDSGIVLLDGDLRPGVISPNDTGHRLGKRSVRSMEPVKMARTKRASLDFNSVLIFPGTKWCGKGDLATCYEDLGSDETDVCCRDHDCCPYIIPPFTSRFNTLNYRFYSVIHCDCDNRFRGCLQNSLSTTANMIGKIYFNVLGSKCFTFEEKEMCAERHWWGQCKTYEKLNKAIVQSQTSFEHEKLMKEAEQADAEAEKERKAEQETKEHAQGFVGNVVDNTIDPEQGFTLT